MPNFVVRTIDGGEYRFAHKADLNALAQELETAGYVTVTITFDSRDRSAGARPTALFKNGVTAISQL